LKGDPSLRPLEFGWSLPTHADITAYGLAQAQVPGSSDLCDRVVQAWELSAKHSDVHLFWGDLPVAALNRKRAQLAGIRHCMVQ
jgi:hypothetical protein